MTCPINWGHFQVKSRFCEYFKYSWLLLEASADFARDNWYLDVVVMYLFDRTFLGLPTSPSHQPWIPSNFSRRVSLLIPESRMSLKTNLKGLRKGYNLKKCIKDTCIYTILFYFIEMLNLPRQWKVGGSIPGDIMWYLLMVLVVTLP